MEPLFADAKVSANSCGTPGRPSFLAPNMVPIWVPELGSELWFAVGHVCMRKVLLNVSLGVVAAPELLGTEQTPYEGGPKKARATPAIPTGSANGPISGLQVATFPPPSAAAATEEFEQDGNSEKYHNMVKTEGPVRAAPQGPP